MGRMRIGIDARLHAYRQGGISTYARELARALVIVGADEQEYIVLQHRRESSLLVPGAKWARLQTPPHHRWEAWALSIELAPLGLDVLHSTDFIPPKRGARWHVITVHDLAFLLYPQYLTAASRRYYNRQIRSAVRRADHILAVSAATKADIEERLNVSSERITVQHHGYRMEFRPFSPEEVIQARAHWRLPEDYFLFVGTMEPRKNIGGLLAGYRQLRAELPTAPPLLLCAPPGWGSEDILRQLEDAAGVQWRESTPAAALPALYAGARALVLPSHYEGFGLPTLEAMACGTPPIVSDIPALREVVGNVGWRIDPTQPATIAAALRATLEQSERLERERAAALQRAGSFSWRRSAEIARAVYEDLR